MRNGFPEMTNFRSSFLKERLQGNILVLGLQIFQAFSWEYAFLPDTKNQRYWRIALTDLGIGTPFLRFCRYVSDIKHQLACFF